MHRFELEIVGSRLTTIDPRPGLSMGSVPDRARKILTLFRALASSDEIWLNLSDVEVVSREGESPAMEKACDRALQGTTIGVEVLEARTDGKAWNSDRQIPKFENGRSLDV